MGPQHRRRPRGAGRARDGHPLAAEQPGAGAPVRRFTDPDYLPQAQTLGELRQHIDALDVQIVALLAERALCVRDATRFKRDAFQVSAPARQAQVFAKVRELAQPHEDRFPGLADIVESIEELKYCRRTVMTI